MAKYYYALVYKSTGKLALLGAEVPIFWLRKAAKRRLQDFTTLKIARINIKQLDKLVKDGKSKQTRPKKKKGSKRSKTLEANFKRWCPGGVANTGAIG